MQEAAKSAPSGAAADAAAPTESEAHRSRSELAQRDDRKLGTGHGEREYSPTTQTQFERASSSPSEIVQVRYDSVQNLMAAGIIPRPRPIPRQPDAFPSFVPDPA
jgi:hypothetical protein